MRMMCTVLLSTAAAVYLLIVVSLNFGVSGSPCTTDSPRPYKANMARETAETMAKDRVLNSCKSAMVRRVPKIEQYNTRCFVFSAVVFGDPRHGGGGEQGKH